MWECKDLLDCLRTVGDGAIGPRVIEPEHGIMVQSTRYNTALYGLNRDAAHPLIRHNRRDKEEEDHQSDCYGDTSRSTPVIHQFYFSFHIFHRLPVHHVVLSATIATMTLHLRLNNIFEINHTI